MLKNDKFYIRAKELAAQLTGEEKLGLITTHHNAVERLGLGEFYIGTEVARGYVGRDKEHTSTVFPQPIGLASTFDRELMERLGEVAGKEARAYYNADKKGGLALWGPTVDMVRNPLWGRTEEAYGEDVCLAGELTAAYTKGMAGENEDGYYMTVPTLKHFCANNNEEKRGSCSAYLTPRLKREYYYAAFEIPIRDGGARSIMAAYNELNGVPAIMDPDIQTILKDEWGLWFVVSDGGDFSQNVIDHRYTETHSEAYELCLKAGSDTMTDEDSLVRAAAERALEQGLISWDDIDRSVVNTLYARLRLGQLDETEFDKAGKDDIDTEQSRRLNRRAATEQVTLLKNNGLLPLSKDKKVAVAGPLCDDCLMDWYTGFGTYENTILSAAGETFREVVTDSLWDVAAVKAPNGKYLCAYEDGSVRADADSITDACLFEIQNWGENWKNFFSVKYSRYVRLFDDGSLKLHNRRIYDWYTRETFNFRDYCGSVLIEEFLTHGRVVCKDAGVLGISRQRAVQSDQLFEIEYQSRGEDRARELAKNVDAVIYCVGNYPVQTAKECYDRKTLELNIQPGMTQVLAGENKNTVLVCVSSYPYSIVEESESAAAVMWTSHAGAELGTAVSAVLTGDSEPTGRTPITWYKSVHDLPDIMDYDIESSGATYMYFGGEALYPFGYGLSYCEFEYGSMSLCREGGRVKVKLDIKNTSDRDGTEVVQVYFTVADSAVRRAARKLCGFERVAVKAGGTVTAEITVKEDILRIFDVKSERMILESGTYEFMAGASSKDIRQRAKLLIEGVNIGKRRNKFSANMFDSLHGGRLFWSKKLGCEYVRSTGWGATAVYEGVDFTQAGELVLGVSCIAGQRELTVKIGDKEYKTKIAPSDRFDGFESYVIKIDRSDASSLAVELPQFVALLDIELR